MFKVLRNVLLRYILYTCPKPNVTRVQSATQWTASVHTLHMSKPKRPRRKGPLPSQSLNPRKKLWVWKARLRCWKRMAIKAWPKGDRKALCHRFSNAQSGFKELEAERHWGEVAQVIQSIGFGGFSVRRTTSTGLYLTVKSGTQDDKEWVPSKCSSCLDRLSQRARPHQARPV